MGFRFPHTLFRFASAVLVLGGLVVSPALGFDLYDNDSCMMCHGEPDLMGFVDGIETSMFVDMDLYHASVHAGLSCVFCHSDITELPHDASLARTNCTDCHGHVVDALRHSVHDIEDGPSCTDCHGDPHMILPNEHPDSRTNLFQVAHMCGECHSDTSIMRPYQLDVLQREQLFQESVHAVELLKGNENAPSCVHCHGAHTILPLRDPDSRTYFMNVAETCGQCHKSAKVDYLESVHGKSAMRGHKDAPICTDCHGEHAIFRKEDPRSPISFFNVSGNTCGRCHASIVINEKYNIPTMRVESYGRSYHGLALEGGSRRTAQCASCHGYHLILPSEDPRSTVSQERLVETCGQCHPGISTNILAAPIHTYFTVRSDAIQAWVPRIYIPLILLLIGGMILHNGVIWWALLKEKYRREHKQAHYNRFTTFEVICHIFLTVSFIVLVITGFALVNPNSWWVTGLSFIGFNEEVRSLLHRIGGIVMIAVSLAYAFYMIASPRGRSEVWAFMLWPRDAVHAWHHLGFYLGKRSEPPKFDRYDYTEKLEFWALIWGVIIMAVTGLMLWFPVLSLQYLPKWAIDMAHLIHYYEAVLATLAIIVWHFFFVIFHPEEYPMSVTWLSGKMTVEHLKRRHPLEYERLVKEGKIKEEPEDRSADQELGSLTTESQA